MKGSLRMLVGFALVFGAVGAGDGASFAAVALCSIIGLLIMWWGIEAMKSL
jgi:hypothetical protein